MPSGSNHIVASCKISFFPIAEYILHWVSVGSLYLELFLVSWILMSASFPRLGKFSAIISSDKFSAPFSLSSFWDRCNANIDFLGIVLSVLSHLHSFTFCGSDWMKSALSLSFWNHSSASSSLLSNPSIMFFSSVIILFSSMTSTWYFLLVSIWWNSHFVHASFCWPLWASLWPLIWTLLSVSLRSFFEILSFSLFRIYSSVFNFFKSFVFVSMY